MTRLLLTTFGIFALQFANCQSITFSSNFLDFGTNHEKQLDSLSLTITNTSSSFAASCTLLCPIRYYGSRPFYVKDSTFTIAPTASKQVWIYCKIAHNLLNNGELIVSTSFGDYAIDLRCQGHYTKVYYNSSENLRESALETALRTKLGQNVNSLSYNGIRDEMYGNYDNHNDSVTCIYTNRKAKFNTRSGATTNNFNCEHTFPQGYFGSASPMVSDGHHLFPTDETANNSRGNLPFGVATPPYINPAGNAPSLNGGGKYEPQDSHKGNCARAMLYFRVRYQDYQNFFAPQADLLYTWHRQAPPQPKDTIRQLAIFALQNNRNPFIDYPQLADRLGNLWSIGNLEAAPAAIPSKNELNLSFANDQLVIWNPSFQPVQVTGFGFLHQLAGWNGPAPQPVTLQKGESITLKIKDLGISLNQPDTLVYSYGSPATQIQIPINSFLVGNKPVDFRPAWYISPNPSSDLIHVTTSDSSPSPASFQLFDLQGKVFISSLLDGPVSIAHLAKGMYFLNLQSEGKSKSFRILKN